MIGTQGVQPLALGASAVPAGFVAVCIGLGALVAIVGHLAGSRRAAATGIAILFAASALMIVGAYLAYRDDPNDPRPCPPEATC
jgi:ABC-type Na+ efflux pump permease subunit